MPLWFTTASSRSLSKGAVVIGCHSTQLSKRKLARFALIQINIFKDIFGPPDLSL
jgi:hypothetical protein